MSTKNLISDFGNLQSFESNKTGLSGKTENGKFSISTYASNVLRFQLSASDEYQVNPYSVIATPQEDLSEVSESNEVVQVKTADITLKIQKNPFRCTFFNADGEMLSDDDQGLGTAIQGTTMTQYRKLQEGERFLGMGEKTGHIDRRGSGFINWNTDRFAFGTDQDPLYASIPFFIGTHHGLVYGIYLDNTHRSDFNFGASNNRFSSFSVDSGDLDYYFITGNSVQDVISSYANLTGHMPLPPVWSIGYQQCRYSYYPQTEVERLSEKFRDKKIPADVIVLDIHYMEKFKIFTWDGEKFSDPKAMIEKLKERGFEVVVICDPGIKVLEGYEAYESGIKEDIFIKYPDGTEYTGEVWPGWCHFPDFTSEVGRKWWKEKFKTYTDLGIKGYWNDMNEIASWGNMMPENVLFDFEGEGATSRRARNVYGFQMARASHEAAKELTKERPFTLTRAGFAGLQRYSALWTGDNISTDEHMMLAVRMILSLGMSGVPFAGSDIGGFVGNTEGRLFARWIQIAAFAPFFRAHTMINSNSAEPWSFGEEVEEISANFIKLRYRLLPHLYNAFREASETGKPVNRSLALDYTFDDRVYDREFENQFFLGDGIMVAPLESYKDVKKVFLPEGKWFEFFSGDQNDGNRTFFHECGIKQLPIYIKGSTIIPMYPEIGRNNLDIGDTLELHVYNGDEKYETSYYEDDGKTFDYQADRYHLRSLTFEPSKGKIMLSPSEGSYPSKMRKLRVLLHGFGDPSIKVNGKNAEVKKVDYEFIKPISNFDPMVSGNDDGHPRNYDLPFVELDYTDGQIEISFD